MKKCYRADILLEVLLEFTPPPIEHPPTGTYNHIRNNGERENIAVHLLPLLPQPIFLQQGIKSRLHLPANDSISDINDRGHKQRLETETMAFYGGHGLYGRNSSSTKVPASACGMGLYSDGRVLGACMPRYKIMRSFETGSHLVISFSL